MLNKNDMMDLLVTADSIFGDDWKKMQVDWSDQKEDLPYYAALGVLARHVKSLLDKNEDDKLVAIFEAVEQLHAEGDEFVMDAVNSGFLEELKSISESSSLDASVYDKYLLPDTRFWWQALHASSENRFHTMNGGSNFHH